MGKAKDTPVAPPTVTDERPKALEDTVQQSEPAELPDAKPGTGGEKESAKEIVAETPTPKVQADLAVDQQKDQNIGSSDIPKP